MCQKSSSDKNVYTDDLIEMNFLNLEKLLRINAKSIAILRITGGEPFLYSDFEKLIDLLNEINLKYSILTNGSLIHEKIAQKLLKNCLEISISIDSADNDIYSYMRKGGNLEVVKKNIQYLNIIKKKTPYLNIATTCFTFNIDGLSDLVVFCHENKIPTISVCEGGYYNTPFIKDEHFVRTDMKQCYISVNNAQKTADNLGVTIRWNSQMLYFSKEENQIISNRNPVVGCIDFFFSGIITPDFKLKICPLSNPICDIKDGDLKSVWNGTEINMARKIIQENNFPSTCRYCPDYNEHFNEKGKEYSFIDYQKHTQYWKL